jgi:hypothetical protein
LSVMEQRFAHATSWSIAAAEIAEFHNGKREGS